MKWGIILVIALAVVVALLSFLLLRNPSQEQQPLPTVSQENAGVQEESAEAAPVQNYIKISGIYKKLVGKISPSEGKKIKGIVEITLTAVPEGMEGLSFVILLPGQKAQEVGPNLGVDSSGDDGWGMLLDTNGYANGLYDIGIVANRAGSDGPIDAASIQVIIEN